MALSLPPKTSTDAHEIAPHLSLQWQDKGKQAWLILSDLSRASLESYQALVKTLLDEGAYSQHLKLLHNLTDPSLSVTPFAREQLGAVFSGINKAIRQGKSALLVDQQEGRWIASVAQQIFARPGNIKQRLFYRQPAALDWLNED